MVIDTGWSDGALAHARREIEASLRAVPDFPKPGISFIDVMPVLAAAHLRAAANALLVQQARLDYPIDAVVGVESRGFLFGVGVADALGVPFVPARKHGKLPGEVLRVTYDLEYGQDSLELQAGVLRRMARVLIIDDVLATGGTAAAVAKLVRAAGATPVSMAVLIEIAALGGRAKLEAEGLGVRVVFSR